MPKTLLLADDSVVIQKLVALSFANEDVELVTVYNGDDAVTKAQEVRPNLVLADVVMPGKNGYEVCEAIKQNSELAGVPVLLLTGTFEAFDEDRAREAGSDGHITKPFEAQALVDRVNELLAAPPAPAASTETAAQSASAAAGNEASAYDFFDDDAESLAASQTATPATPDPLAPSADAPAFGFSAPDAPELEPLPADPAAVDPLADTRPEPGNDRTIAMLPPESLASGDAGDAPTVTASGFEANVSGFTPPEATDFKSGLTPPEVTDFKSGLTPPPAAPPISAESFDEDVTARGRFDHAPAGDATVIADLSSDTNDPAESAASISVGHDDEPMATVVAEDAFPVSSLPTVEAEAASDPVAVVTGEVEFGSPAAPATGAPRDPSATLLADDLFDDPAGSQAPVALARDDDFEFSFDAAAPAGEPPPELDFGDEGVPPGGTTQPELEVGSTSAFDVSASDLADSFAAVEPEPPSSSLPIPEAASWPEPPSFPEAPPVLDPLPESVASTQSAERAVAEPARADAIALPSTPDLTPMLRERVHETLEKVAWEAFADLSDTIVRQVLERVEAVAWEVIPQMAETLIQEEIRRMKAEDGE